MRRYSVGALLSALLAFATHALATVTPLPGVTPQHAAPKVFFANPIAVQVTDATGQPAQGALVRWRIDSFAGPLVMESWAGCFYDAGENCSTTTDMRGIAVLGRMYGNYASTTQLPVLASLGETSLGQTTIVLVVDPTGPEAAVAAIQGASQRAVIGTTYGIPFGIRAMREGAPVAGVSAYFQVSSAFGAARGTFSQAGSPSPEVAIVTTDENGYAYAPPFTAGWGVGSGTLSAGIVDSASGRPVFATFDFTNTNASGGTSLHFQDLWWGGESEAGWGVSITQHGDALFSLLFAYNDDGTPTWYVMSTGQWEAGLGSTFRPFVHKTKGTPFFAYDASKLLLEPAGGLTLSFHGEESGILQGNLFTTGNDGRVLKNLQRFDFTTDPNAPIRGVSDLWWGGPSQSGWGIAIAERPGTLFSMWFTYDENGKATWFAMPDGRWTSDHVFEGRVYSAAGPKWLGTSVPYDVSKFRTTDVGAFRLTFTGSNAAQFDYTVNGRSGSLPLTRTPFGDD